MLGVSKYDKLAERALNAFERLVTELSRYNDINAAKLGTAPRIVVEAKFACKQCDPATVYGYEAATLHASETGHDLVTIETKKA